MSNLLSLSEQPKSFLWKINDFFKVYPSKNYQHFSLSKSARIYPQFYQQKILKQKIPKRIKNAWQKTDNQNCLLNKKKVKITNQCIFSLNTIEYVTEKCRKEASLSNEINRIRNEHNEVIFSNLGQVPLLGKQIKKVTNDFTTKINE